MFQLLDVVKLKRDDPEAGVPKGTEGTIVDVFDEGVAYTIEFVDENGHTYKEALFKEYSEDWIEASENSGSVLLS